MRRNWDKYIHRNRTEGDCQLVSAVNAYYYLTGKTINEKTYQEYVDLCGCRHGSAISIKKVWKKLGIKMVRETNNFFDLKISDERKKMLLPLEYNVWHKRYGFHSTLIVDHVPKVGCCRVTNLRYATSQDGWMFCEDMYQFEYLTSANNENISKNL